ncbi:MAG: hypothetical protein RMJ98_12740 [Myxococcales bacterium]|nr:hypothetical protein [Polyangiaceae bacterium]MDW8250153.1 hypothetical protein [Myxococcales bacterium]
MANDLTILLVDEPTSNLDSHEREFTLRASSRINLRDGFIMVDESA